MKINSFLAPDNPLGWSAGDVWFVGTAVVFGLIFLRLSRTAAPAWWVRLANRPPVCAAVLFVLPVLLRLGLFGVAPIPVPAGSDDFGYLFLADTLRHGRLANPALALHQFFEQIFILQQPTRAAMFPLGQGLVLLLGWPGILLAVGALSAATYWMLRGWLSPQWALAGGVLAVCEFGPLCYWTNCYWGGVLSPLAGCLVFGALPRLARKARGRDAVLLGIGLGLEALTRQYEFFLLLLAFLLWVPRLRVGWKLLWMTVLCCAPALLLIGAQNRAITGSVRQFPYLLYRYQYGVPATFTVQSNAVPHRELNQLQELDYRTEAAVHGSAGESVTRFAERFYGRLRFWRFFLYAPLWIGFFAALPRAPMRILLALAVFLLGSNFYPYFYPHYVGAIACVFLLIALWGLERLQPAWAVGILMACVVQFGFWYAVRVLDVTQLTRYESWDFVNPRDPQGRGATAAQLSAQAGKQLVFVHYSPVHGLSEWIHNEADLQAARVVYAHDLGDEQNGELVKAFPRRTVWLLEPDQVPPKLSRYVAKAAPFEDVR